MGRFLVVCFLGVALFVACGDDNVTNPVDSTDSVLGSSAVSLTAAKPAFTSSCVPAPPDVISWWPLDETSGTTAADVVGPNSGIHANGPLPSVGKVAGGLSFDGANDHIVVPNDASFGFVDWTVDAWIQTTNAGSSFRRIISQQVGTATATSGTGFWVVGLEYNELAVCSQTMDGGLDTPNDGTSGFPGCITYDGQLLDDGLFHHVAVTREAGVAVSLYIDGAVVKTKATTNTAGYDVTPIADDVFIGAASTDFGPAVQNFGGTIDEIELYDRALSASEIAAIFNAGSDGKCKDPLTKDDCKKGGWAQYGFKNQGQCVRFVETGKDSR